MSQTLFFYIFKDLLKVFFLTAIALAGIMSFGGLLRPLTENGLDGRQVGMMLAYLLPAMATYSLPIAALFATTMIYGRLSADNEITACRAGGISFLSIATPAFLLGLFVSIVSLLLLCFIVPAFTFKVEQIIYSNLARVVANKIERNHQISIPGKDKDHDTVIFAQQAFVPPRDPTKPDEQVVVLSGPIFANYEKVIPADKNAAPISLPKRFFMARKATIFITRTTGDTLQLEAQLDDGAQFPRDFAGHSQANVSALTYGPFPIESQVKEHPKFMPITQLRAILQDNTQSRAVRDAVSTFIRSEQDRALRTRFLASLTGPQHSFSFRSDTGVYTFSAGSRRPYVDKNTLVIPSAPDQHEARVRIDRPGGNSFSASAFQILLTLISDPDNGRVIVQGTLKDASIDSGPSPALFSVYPLTDSSFPMPADLQKIQSHSPEYYVTAKTTTNALVDQQKLNWTLVRLTNYIKSEMHGRASFAVSCFVLVLVGTSLGLLFRSSNFLSAFAVSVIPALISIALVVTGQHTMEGVPQIVTAANNPLHLGIALIWSGNAAVLLLGVILLTKLQRT